MSRYKLIVSALFVAFLLSGCSSQKSDAEVAKIEAHKQSICNSVTGIAENIMTARLDGAPIRSTIDVVDNMDGSDPMDAALKIKSKEMIMEAYKKPDYMTDEHKERAITEFGSAQYIKCIDDGFAEDLVRSQK